MIFQLLYFIGGIGNFSIQLNKKYKDCDITIRCRDMAIDQVIALSKYCNIEMDNDKKFECDILYLEAIIIAIMY